MKDGEYLGGALILLGAMLLMTAIACEISIKWGLSYGCVFLGTILCIVGALVVITSKKKK